MSLKALIITGMVICISALNSISFAATEGNFTLNRINTLTGHKDDVDSVSFSSDGTLLATGGEDKVIILWDTKTWKEVRQLKGHDDKITALAFSRDGKILASGDNGSKAILWDLVTGKELRRIKVGDDVNAIAFSLDGKLVAIASNSKNVLLWEISSSANIQKLTGHKDDIKAVAFSHDGKYLASSGNDKSVIVWEVPTGKIIKQLNAHSDDINSIAITPNGKYLASGGNDKKIILWDLATGTAKKIFSGNFNSIKAVTFINKGDVLVAAEGESKYSCRLRFWDTENGKLLASERSDCALTGFSFNSDEKLVAIAAKKITIMNREVTRSEPQNEPNINDSLELSEIVQVPGVKSGELFSRAHAWFVNTFISANNVIQITDKENGILMGKGSFKYVPDTSIGYVGLSGYISFTVKIILKDGRYKYVFNDFRHSGTPAMGPSFFGVREMYEQNYGLLTNSDTVPEGVEYGRNSVWNHMRELSFKEANSMADNLKAQMEIPAKGKNDW